MYYYSAQISLYFIAMTRMEYEVLCMYFRLIFFSYFILFLFFWLLISILKVFCLGFNSSGQTFHKADRILVSLRNLLILITCKTQTAVKGT